jgi:hypothetical protein
LHGNMQGRGQWEWKSTVQFWNQTC